MLKSNPQKRKSIEENIDISMKLNNITQKTLLAYLETFGDIFFNNVAKICCEKTGLGIK